jgi:hypothetical protein
MRLESAPPSITLLRLDLLPSSICNMRNRLVRRKANLAIHPNNIACVQSASQQAGRFAAMADADDQIARTASTHQQPGVNKFDYRHFCN